MLLDLNICACSCVLSIPCIFLNLYLFRYLYLSFVWGFVWIANEFLIRTSANSVLWFLSPLYYWAISLSTCWFCSVLLICCLRAMCRRKYCICVIVVTSTDRKHCADWCRQRWSHWLCAPAFGERDRQESFERGAYLFIIIYAQTYLREQHRPVSAMLSHKVTHIFVDLSFLSEFVHYLCSYSQSLCNVCSIGNPVW